MKPPTYPARPVNGGTWLPQSIARTNWSYTPKYNGWRVLINVKNGEAYSRNLVRSSIECDFSKAIEKICLEMSDIRINGTFDWLDCEGLERRHGIGKGTLIVLDGIEADGPTFAHSVRRRTLKALFETLPICMMPKEDAVYVPEAVHGDDAPVAWQMLQDMNKEVGVEFYEGLVSKKDDSKYPWQMRSPSEECPFWLKHKFTT